MVFVSSIWPALMCVCLSLSVFLSLSFSVSVCLCLFVCLCLSISLSLVSPYLSVFLVLFLSLCLSVCLFVCLPVCLSINLSLSLSLSLFIFLCFLLILSLFCPPPLFYLNSRDIIHWGERGCPLSSTSPTDSSFLLSQLSVLQQWRWGEWGSLILGTPVTQSHLNVGSFKCFMVLTSGLLG